MKQYKISILISILNTQYLLLNTKHGNYLSHTSRTSAIRHGRI